MRLAPSEEQLAFAAALHGMLAATDLPKVSAAWADGDPGPGRALWSALAAAGVTGLLVPECFGGLGAGPADLVIACEELGHHAVPGPIAESLATVPALLSAAASYPPGDHAATSTTPHDHATTSTPPQDHATTSAARDDHATTSHNHATASTPPRDHSAASTPPRDHATPSRDHATASTPSRDHGAARTGRGDRAARVAPARREAGEWLSMLARGRKIASVVAPPWSPLAVDGDSADLILVVDGDEIREGTAGRVWPSLHPARRLSEVEPLGVIASGQDSGRALDLGVLACSAQLLGAARALLEMSVEHARQRTQFGRAIGSFQAVQHRLADVAVAIEFARPLLYAAAVALTPGPVKADGPPAPGDAGSPPKPDHPTARNSEAAVEQHGLPDHNTEAPAAPHRLPDHNTEAAAQQHHLPDHNAEIAAQQHHLPGHSTEAAAQQHHLPDHNTEAAAERCVWSGGGGVVDVSAAKVACGAAARLAARVALQTHGAVGYTREHGLWRWLGLVRVLDLGWGTPSWHRARILAELASGTAGDHPDQPGGRRTAGSGQVAAWSGRNGPDPVGNRHARTGEEGF